MSGNEKLRNEKLTPVQLNAIYLERIGKEQRHQRLHTEFSINPHKRLHVLTDKPMSRKPTELIEEDSAFIEAFHKARLEPTKKYSLPLTESQEIGWVSDPLIPSNCQDQRFNFHRASTDVTRHTESALRKYN